MLAKPTKPWILRRSGARLVCCGPEPKLIVVVSPSRWFTVSLIPGGFADPVEGEEDECPEWFDPVTALVDAADAF